MDVEKVKMLDIILVLLKRKYFIFFFTLVMCILTLIYTLVVEETWTSEATILPIDTAGNINISSSLLEGFGLGSNVNITALNLKYAGVLKSRKITQQVIEKYNFIEYLKIKTKDPNLDMDLALKQFHKKILKINISDDTDFLTISITTKNKQFSREIAEYYLSILLEYITNNANNIGRQKRELFESRVNEITTEMLEITEEMKKYQSKHNIVDIENQAKASIAAYSLILEDFFRVELELEYAEKYMPNTLAYQNLLERKNSITESLRKLEANNNDTPFLLAMNNINSNLFTVKEGVFRLEVIEKLLETIYPQLELARIEELEKMDKYEVIDYPYLPGLRTYPKRALICIIAFFISLLFSCGFILMRELISENSKAKLIEIWHKLFH